MKTIDISTKTYPNTFIKVDDDDFDFVNQWKWIPLGIKSGRKTKIYVIRKVYHTPGSLKYETILIHRLIMKTPPDLVVDHIDGDGLNNQKLNMRNCTRSQNPMNHPGWRGKKSSRFKGVFRHPTCIKYHASICVPGNRNLRLGSFAKERDAAIAYNEAAIKYHGEFANLNEIPPE